MGDKSFSEKYGLVGRAKKVRISKETLAMIKALNNASRRFIEAGKDYSETEKKRFGGPVKTSQ